MQIQFCFWTDKRREVMNTVNNRTPAQNDTVFWWRDASGTQTPAGHWMGILQYVIHLKGL
jgi:hypothetical protein